MDRIRQIILMSEIVAALLAWFVVGAAAETIMAWGAIPDPLATTPFPAHTLAGLICGVAVFLVLDRRSDVQEWAHDVTEELLRVKWPTYEETRLSTIVVMVTVAIITVILGFMDFVFSSLTGLIYN